VPLRLLSQINFNHLYYFWVVAREGSITRATTLLHLAQPTVSSQLRTLERTLGERLFERRGRGIALTETGTMVFRYADAMFGTARELAAALEGGPAEHPSRFAIGISDALPKLTATRLLTPAFASALPMYLECRSDKTERLLAALAIHEIDLVIADAPVPAGLGVRLFSHLIGESGVSIFAVPALAAKHRRRFPQSLDDAPMLLGARTSALRRAVDSWCARERVRPRIVAEVEDAAVLQALGAQGLGLFAAPTVVEAEIRRAYGVRVVGRLHDVHERFYAISAERKLQHPAVLKMLEAASTGLFAHR
jgi:LysR family transcriptional activator of nhaA